MRETHLGQFARHALGGSAEDAVQARGVVGDAGAVDHARLGRHAHLGRTARGAGGGGRGMGDGG